MPTGPRQVTRDVEPSHVRTLLDHPPRATVAFADGERIALLPVRACFGAGGQVFGVASDVAPDLEHREVVLLVDDGPYWFELRGVSFRGIARRADPVMGTEGARLSWYSVEPRRVLAWDYGSIRQE